MHTIYFLKRILALLITSAIQIPTIESITSSQKENYSGIDLATHDPWPTNAIVDGELQCERSAVKIIKLLNITIITQDIHCQASTCEEAAACLDIKLEVI